MPGILVLFFQFFSFFFLTEKDLFLHLVWLLSANVGVVQENSTIEEETFTKVMHPRSGGPRMETEPGVCLCFELG